MIRLSRTEAPETPAAELSTITGLIDATAVPGPVAKARVLWKSRRVARTAIPG